MTQANATIPRLVESVRFPRENGESAGDGVNGIIELTNTASLIADWPLFGSAGCMAFTAAIPLLQYNLLRRRACMIGMGPSATSARSLSFFWQGGDSLFVPAGFTDKQNRGLFYMRDTAGADTILGTGVLPPEKSATETTVTNLSIVSTYNNPFPPDLDSHGDWSGRALFVIGRDASNRMQVRVWDLETLDTYHGPLVAYSGAGIAVSPASAYQLCFGGADSANFPTTAGDTSSQTMSYFRGEIGNFMVVNRHTTDAEWLAFLNGADPSGLFGANLRLAVPFVSDGVIQTSTIFLGAGTAPTLTVKGEIGAGSNHRPNAAAKWIKPRPLKDPCLLAVPASARTAALYVTAQTMGIADGKPLRVRVVDADDTVVVDDARVGKVAGNAVSGWLDIPGGPKAHYLVYDCDGVTWRDNAPVWVGFGFTGWGQSQWSYITNVGSSFGNSGTPAGDATAGTTPIPPVWRSSVAHRSFVVTRAVTSIFVKPGILIGEYNRKMMGTRRIEFFEHCARYTDWPIFLIEQNIGGTGIRQLFSDDQATLNSAGGNAGTLSYAERMWSDSERIQACLGSLTRSNLYAATVHLHWWGSAENAPIYGPVLDAFFFGVPETSPGGEINQAMLDAHYIFDGKTFDPDAGIAIAEFNRSTSPLVTTGDSSPTGLKRQAQRDWAKAKGLTLGPPTAAHYLMTWNTTKLNPPASVTHSQIDYDLGGNLLARSMAETFMNAVDLGSYKGVARHDWANMRFTDGSRTKIVVPVAGPPHGHALHRIDQPQSAPFRGLPLWGYEYSEGNNSSYTPVKLLASISSSFSIEIVKSDETAFNATTWIRFNSGSPAAYNFSAMQTLFVNSTGGQHARGLDFKEENFVAWQPTWNGWQLEGSNDGGLVLPAL